jgi:hypothetical protein
MSGDTPFSIGSKIHWLGTAHDAIFFNSINPVSEILQVVATGFLTS